MKKVIPRLSSAHSFECPECGTDDIQGTKYCPNCGVKFDWYCGKRSKQ